MLLLYKLNPVLLCSYPSLLNAKTWTLLHKARLPLHPKISGPQKLSFDRGLVHIKRFSTKGLDLDTQIVEQEEVVRVSDSAGGGDGGGDSGGGGGGGDNWSDWLTSGLLFGLWAGLMYYVFRHAPDQTRYRDMYFL